MVMLTGAFDVSQDQPNRRFLIMAGFISDAERWVDFDRKWRERLAADDLPYFHMNLFAQSKKIFKGWEKQEDKRRKLIRDLLEIIVEHAYYKFATAVQVEAFGRLSPEVRKEFAPTPIAAAGRFIAGLVFQWRDRERYRGVPEFVFEEGDEDRGSLIRAMKKLTGKEPVFRPKKDDPEKQIVAFTPLQAADILAYEVKQITDEIGRILPPDFRFRFPYEHVLNKIPGEPKIFPLERVSETDSLLKIDQHFVKNPLGKAVS